MAETDPARDELEQRAADGLLINGSQNNGASSPFALFPAFGNNRNGSRSLYNGGLGIFDNNAIWDARTFSFTGQNTPKPGYNLFTATAYFGGPLKIPHLVKNGPNFFVELSVDSEPQRHHHHGAHAHRRATRGRRLAKPRDPQERDQPAGLGAPGVLPTAQFCR